eukprot:jgi/Tetstr1/459256/TSEL_000417.t1
MLPAEAKGGKGRAASANAATPKKMREELLKAVYQGASAASLEALLKQAARLGMDEEDEYVATARRVASLLRLKLRAQHCVKQESRSGLNGARELLREVANKDAEVMQGGPFKEALAALERCDVDLDAADAVASKDVAMVEAALQHAQRLRSHHTVSRIQEFYGHAEVAGQQNDFLRQQMDQVSEASEALREELRQAQSELGRVRRKLEEQDKLAARYRGERDEARQWVRELEDQRESAVAEAQAATNLAVAELDTQRQRAEELERQLAAAGRELRGRRASSSSAEASATALAALRSSSRRSSAAGHHPADSGPLLQEEHAELMGKTRREELLEAQVQRLNEKIAIYQRMYRIGIV